MMYQHPLLLMAPRRDSTDTITSCNMPFQCCVPTGDCLKKNIINYAFINNDQYYDAIRIICSNENCTSGQYMHAECFEQWEQSVLTYLKSIGRARSWSDKQRHQNLWTKKGYDLVYKVCGCLCGRGHIKKDLDWAPPITASLFGGRLEEESTKKSKKKKNKNNQKPSLSIMSSTPNGTGYPTNQMLKLSTSIVDNILEQQLSVSTPQSTIRGRAGSLTSSNGSSSPASSANGEVNLSVSPIQSKRAVVKQRYLEQGEMYSDRIR
jgi:headcase protein